MSTSTGLPQLPGRGEDHPPEVQGLRRQRRRPPAEEGSRESAAGIDNGQAISVRGQGDMGRNGGPAGDLIVGINGDAPCPAPPGRRPHLLGSDGFHSPGYAGGVKWRFPLWMAKIKCNVEPGTQPAPPSACGAEACRPSTGRGRGDQYVTIRVEIPRNLNEDQKEALRKFAEAMGELPASSSAGESGERSVFHRRKKK